MSSNLRDRDPRRCSSTSARAHSRRARVDCVQRHRSKRPVCGWLLVRPAGTAQEGPCRSPLVLPRPRTLSSAANWKRSGPAALLRFRFRRYKEPDAFDRKSQCSPNIQQREHTGIGCSSVFNLPDRTLRQTRRSDQVVPGHTACIPRRPQIVGEALRPAGQPPFGHLKLRHARIVTVLINRYYKDDTKC